MKAVGPREHSVQKEWADALVEVLTMTWGAGLMPTLCEVSGLFEQLACGTRRTEWEISSTESATERELLSRLREGDL